MGHWDKHAKQWDLIGAPLRPSPQDVNTIQSGILDDSKPVLVLGITPELTRAFPRIVAIDKNPAMLNKLWTSDPEQGTAICEDWLTFSPNGLQFGAVVGDGCFTVLGSGEAAERLIKHLNSILDPGTDLRFRLFVRPESTWSKGELHRLIKAREAPKSFHAFKWMIAMHLASFGKGVVSVRAILQFFNDEWGSRNEVSRATGWSLEAINTIDAYGGSSDIYWFPTINEFMEIMSCHLESPVLSSSTGYELCEQCPVLVAKTRRN